VNSWVAIGLTAAALAVVILVRTVRRIVARVISVTVAVLAILGSIAGAAILMNNVTIYDSPGVAARVLRFLSVDWAATSADGLSLAPCAHGWADGHIQPAPARSAANAAGAARESRGRVAGKAAAAAAPTPAASEEEAVPELVRHGYPGISRGKLFELANATVSQLGGWKIVNADPRAGVLDCVYTTRIFRWEDDVRIIVSANSEIDLCSRSRVGAPDSGSWLGIFPGDFAANVGHIKEFYEALEPRVDAFYKEQERKMNGERR
jgi:uncharacterized protein (DUF1499 family)